MHKTDKKVNHDPTLPSSPLKYTPIKNQRLKRFTRKPTEKSQRSSSRKSFDYSAEVKQSYIKTPSMSRVQTKNNEDFFKSLASSVMTASTDKKYFSSTRKVNQSNGNIQANQNKKIETLEAEIQLKNHESIILSNECQRFKVQYDEEKERRRKAEAEKKEISKQIKEHKKEIENMKTQMKKIIKEKEYLTKQIQFLERINYDEKTRTLQSYREKYLETQVQKLKDQIKKSRSQVEQDLENEIKKIKQEKYNIESHYKAMKVANECLIKQLNHNSENITEFILHSEEYTKLREKYVRFLEEYKQLRNQYWSLKTEVNVKNESSIFSFTVSEASGEMTGLF